ncbi:SMI1/KNR4 family protein [Hymenobacter sp. BT635]|uniref:SMI1/KNR4 family protein n=1 Tax=Hymenobacter nitidus TaxID=2880929 RepID=A0ABS8AGL7_9BACT|nr:SMI1/KNR4 family protein [Hymenobacter nitidus]MCB2378144.1 SMI1/KNR4 family protein [Hymenobacter nitidus]
MMNSTNWSDTLRQISQEILSDPDFISGNMASLVRPEQRQAQWLGATGATEATLLSLEKRLQISLPASYRAFLQTSDGFGPLDYFIWRLKPCAEVDWLVKTDEDLIQIWERNMGALPTVPDDDYYRYGDSQIDEQLRVEYLRGCLMISDWGDSGFLALNPAVQHEGEWEAWHFANWKPGATRYRSFAELMQNTLKMYREITREQ